MSSLFSGSWLRRAGVSLAIALVAGGIAATPASAAASKSHGWAESAKAPIKSAIRHNNEPIPSHLPHGARLVANADSTGSYIPAPTPGPTQSNWQVTYTGFDAASNPNGPAAQAAFQAAVDIWSQIVKSPITIKVDADFSALPEGVLGEASPSAFYTPGNGAYYASALADELADANVSVGAGGPSEDIDADFTNASDADFYFGTDGQVPSGDVDFESVVLHELGHGLGFLGAMSVDNGLGGEQLATPYDLHTYDAATAGKALSSYPNNSTSLAAALQSGSVYWQGNVAVANNGGNRPKLFAPSPWQDGSSYSHLDEATYPIGNANSLMTPGITNQEAIHNPGPIAVGMLIDEGWQATLPGLVSRPGTPTNVVATGGFQQATVTWDVPASNGAPITSYTVLSSQGGGTCTNTTNTCTVTGLQNGTSYSFEVYATNLAGPSLLSAYSNAVTPVGPPLATDAINVTRGDGSLDVEWAPANNQGDPITGYVATASPGGATCSTTGTLECTITGLTNGTSYTVTVVASNPEGPGPMSEPSAAVTPAGKPTAPTGVSATAAANPGTTAHVSWTAADGNGAQITGYTVTSSPDGETCTTTGATECTVPDLTNGTTYTFTVTATNGVGTSDPSAASSGVTPTGPAAAKPDVPAAPDAVAHNASATVSWTAPFDGGKAIAGYDVEYSTNGTTWTSASSTFHTDPATTQTVSGLTNGVSYSFRVAAINAIDSSSYSVASSPVTPLGPPAAPTSIVAQDRDGAIVVGWVAPHDTGGGQILGYDVEYALKPYTTWVSASNAFHSNPATTETITGLTGGPRLKVRVATITAFGAGVYSLPTQSVAPDLDKTLFNRTSDVTVTYGKRAHLQTYAFDQATGQRILGITVALQSETSSAAGFHTITALHPNSSGVTSYSLRPKRNATYRYVFAGSSTHLPGIGPAFHVLVAPIVSATGTATRVAKNASLKIFGTVTPSAAGNLVFLQHKVGAKWKTLSVFTKIRRQRLPNGHTALGYVIRVPTSATGKTKYRVLRSGSAKLASGQSKAVTVTVTAH